jgi:two pore calcium channel protein
MAQTLIRSIPATAPILALQFTVCTLFSLLGVQLFGGKVYLGNVLLEDTDYAAGRLHAFNYNDYASAMVTSFNLCIVNNWYVIMDAYAVVTHSPWSRVFFISFWAVAVAFTLNVVVAFVVEAFVVGMEEAETPMTAQPSSRSRSESPPRGRLRGRRSLGTVVP